jgi:hypothetical protein
MECWGYYLEYSEVLAVMSPFFYLVMVLSEALPHNTARKETTRQHSDTEPQQAKKWGSL